MGLYEKIIAERAEEEQRRSRPLGKSHGSNSQILDRRLADAREDRSRYGVDLHKLYQCLNRGIRSQGGAMKCVALRRKYTGEFGELKGEHRGQRELW